MNLEQLKYELATNPHFWDDKNNRNTYIEFFETNYYDLLFRITQKHLDVSFKSEVKAHDRKQTPYEILFFLKKGSEKLAIDNIVVPYPYDSNIKDAKKYLNKLISPYGLVNMLQVNLVSGDKFKGNNPFVMPNCEHQLTEAQQAVYKIVPDIDDIYWRIVEANVLKKLNNDKDFLRSVDLAPKTSQDKVSTPTRIKTDEAQER